MPKISVSVSLDVAVDPEAPALKEALSRSGLQVGYVSKLANTIYGEVDERRLAILKAVPGVEAVTAEEKYSLPPVSSRIPQ